MNRIHLKPLWGLCTFDDDLLPETTPPEKPFNYIDISNVENGHVRGPRETLTFGKLPSRARRLASPGDVVISTVRTYLRAVAAVPKKTNNLVFSTGFCVVRPRPDVADSRFIHYLLVSDRVIDEIVADSTGTSYPATSAAKISRLKVPAPSLEKQRAIADYLDRETAEIDAMTADLDKMENLLTERRDAALARLLSEAEQSGMQIRNIRVKFLCDIGTGHGDTQDASDSGAYPFYVRSANVLRSSEWDIQGPAVLTAGDGVGVGRVFHYAEGKMKVHQRVYALTNFRDVSPRFFYEVFRQYFPETVLYGGASSTVSSLRMHMLADLNLPIPPLEEQRRIVEVIDRETAEIDDMLADITELRDLLAERRAALIAAAVTGQIDIPAAEEPTHA